MIKRIWVLGLVVLSGGVDSRAQTGPDLSPLDLQFTRQAVHRLVFDRDQAIPLSMLRPTEVVNLAVEHPVIKVSGGATTYHAKHGMLTASATEASESALWVGGFNPFATYDLAFAAINGMTAETGVEWATPDNRNRLAVLAGFTDGKCTTLRWRVIVDEKERQNEVTTLKQAVEGPFTLRVQMLGSGLNVFVEQAGVNRVVATHDFSEWIDLRRKEHMRTFEFRVLTRLTAGASVAIRHAGASLTTGAGQADLRAITYQDGSPFLDRGRLWFTISVRGRHLAHHLQGVFSLNPSVFDVRLEGIVVFDRDDGLLRNEIASHLFYDHDADQWRGLTVGFSAYGDPDKVVPKQLWAVSSQRDPRFGFSIMKARPVIMPGSTEDPHILFDEAAGKWRVLTCAEGEVGFPATLYEADNWDGPYAKRAGPVDVNSTGCLLQKFGSKYYALFGSADRVFYVYSYPDLVPLGTLDMLRPPWNEGRRTRCWPNVIPLPEGYPAPYIALSMDRANYTGLPGWTYGALYLYHGHVKAKADSAAER